MYDNMKYLGYKLSWWRDNVFHNMFNAGELYRMIKSGVKIEQIN